MAVFIKKNFIRASYWLNACRIKQWIKNLLIFFPAFFSGELLTSKVSESLLLIFFNFSLLSSGIYLLNDCFDFASDKIDDRRHTRPIAAGIIPLCQGLIVGLSLIILSLTGAFLLSSKLLLIEFIYILINLFYNLWGKHNPPCDISLLVLCFLCRMWAGAVPLNIPCSPWLIIMVILLAAMLAAGKRMEILPKPGYNRIFLAILLGSLGTTLLICYIMYTFSLKKETPLYSDFTYLSFLPVLFGMIRYYQCIWVYHKPSCPTELFLQDHQLQFYVILWSVMCFFAIYMK